MTKVILISLYDTASGGPRTLHKVLEEEGHEVYSIFFKSGKLTKATENEIALLIDKVDEIQPQLIGLSLRSRFLRIAIKLTNEIRQHTKAKIIWGGVHPTVRPMECLKYADIVCVGEGENALSNLAYAIGKGQSVSKIKNLWIKDKGKIIKNDLAMLEEDLNSIPYPDYTDTNKFYIEDDVISIKNVFPEHEVVYAIMTTRGCMFSCEFCTGSSLREIYHGKGKFVRRRSVEHVMEELITAKKTWPTIRKVYFLDDVFSYDIKWLKRLSTQYRKHVNLPFYCYVHPLFCNEETIKTLKEMGLIEVNMGIQSGSERVRKEVYSRFETNKQIIEAVKILNKYKIRAVCDLILGNPYDTESDREENLKLLMELPKPIILQTYNMLFFPNKLTERALKDGLITEKDLEENKDVYQRWDNKFADMFSKEDLFWNSLYYFASKGYPQWFVYGCRNKKFLKNHPKILVVLVKIVERTQTFISAVPKILGYIKRRQFGLMTDKIKRNLRFK